MYVHYGILGSANKLFFLTYSVTTKSFQNRIHTSISPKIIEKKYLRFTALILTNLTKKIPYTVFPQKISTSNNIHNYDNARNWTFLCTGLGISFQTHEMSHFWWTGSSPWSEVNLWNHILCQFESYPYWSTAFIIFQKNAVCYSIQQYLGLNEVSWMVLVNNLLILQRQCSSLKKPKFNIYWANIVILEIDLGLRLRL